MCVKPLLDGFIMLQFLFNAANSIFFTKACEAIIRYGPTFRPPTSYELSGPLLKSEVNILNEYLQELKDSWPRTGCTIMSDGWKDQKGRHLINFLVSCPAGMMFTYFIYIYYIY